MSKHDRTGIQIQTAAQAGERGSQPAKSPRQVSRRARQAGEGQTEPGTWPTGQSPEAEPRGREPKKVQALEAVGCRREEN